MQEPHVAAVLVVDDNEDIRDELCRIFSDGDFRVCAKASNGKEAIEIARQTRPQLIILDMSMPVMNGLEAAPELRKLLPGTPIILYTAFADSLAATNFRDQGISLVLSKNEPPEGLIAAARRLLHTQSMAAY